MAMYEWTYSNQNYKNYSNMIEDDGIVPQSKKFLNQRLPKSYDISMPLIIQTSLDSNLSKSLSQQQKIEVILHLKSIRLDRLGIKRIQNLQVFQEVQVLYLQHNSLSKIEGLDHLRNLQYLALNDNNISKLEGLANLKKLQGLNMNNNSIEEIDVNELPPGLQLLSFKNNPAALDSHYKSSILKHLPYLEMLDGQQITQDQRFKTIGIFPAHLMEYSNQMKQFKRKRQIQSQLSEEEQKMNLVSGAELNYKEAIEEIRQKKDKFMNSNQKEFIQAQRQQTEDFKDKIQVSKKIRKIKEKEEGERQKRLHQIKESKLEDVQEEIQSMKRKK